MSERTRTEDQQKVMAEWMLQSDEVPIGFRNQTAFDIYRMRQWWEHQPQWFVISRNVILFVAVVCLFEYCCYQAIVDYFEQVYP